MSVEILIKVSYSNIAVAPLECFILLVRVQNYVRVPVKEMIVLLLWPFLDLELLHPPHL